MREIYAAFLNSVRGLTWAARYERAVRQELALCAVALPLVSVLSGEFWVRIALVAVLLLMLAVELANTAIEKLCDRFTADRDPAIGLVKDLASAAVFCTQMLAALVWAAAAWQAVVT